MQFRKVLFGAVLVLLATGCGGRDTQEAAPVPGGTNSYSQVPQPAPEPTPAPPGATPSVPAPAAPAAYTWEEPEGWEPVPPTPFRQANFLAGPAGEVESYLTVLPGSAGGVAANLNRWRQQMGQEPLDDAALDALPRVSVLRQEAVMMAVDGTYGGMSGELSLEDHRMLGLVVEDGGQMLFVRMTGPVELVAEEEERFVAFAQSLERDPDGAAHGGGIPHAHPPLTGAETNEDLPPGHPPLHGAGGLNMELPPGHPPIPPSLEGAGALSGERSTLAESMRWVAPDGWRRGQERPVRLVTYTLPEDPVTECVVTILAGPAGGAEANINRWREQMGQAALSADEIASLPHIEVLDREAPFVEFIGSFTGMDGVTRENAGLLGVVVTMPEETVFVRMTGPAEVIAEERENFIAFCSSFHVEETPAPTF